jgi:hypothetical protein
MTVDLVFIVLGVSGQTDCLFRFRLVPLHDLGAMLLLPAVTVRRAKFDRVNDGN